jgi:hypothetical protein
MYGQGPPSRQARSLASPALPADVAIRKAVILASAQKTLPIAVAVLSRLESSLGPAVGVAVIPCVMAHLLQTVIDSALVAHWNQQAEAEARGEGGRLKTA